MLQNEKIQVKDLRNQGMSDRQLQEMGFMSEAIHAPAVATAK
jgi:Fe2+ transport system protein FeoA